jgi:hypothetical protein
VLPRARRGRPERRRQGLELGPEVAGLPDREGQAPLEVDLVFLEAGDLVAEAAELILS